MSGQNRSYRRGLPFPARLRYFVTRLEELRELSRAKFPSPPHALGPIEDAMLEAAAEIERIEAENAALKARRTVDDAMVGRAEEAIVESEMYSPGMSTFALARRALEAALGTKADT